MTTVEPLDEALLIHYGVKGMRWGVRKKEDLAGDSPATKEKTTGSSSAAAYKAVKFKKPTPKEARASIQKREETFLAKTNPSENGEAPRKGLSPGQKKALLIGAGALATAAIVGGAYYARKKGYLGGYHQDQRLTAKSLTESGRKYLSQLDQAKAGSWSSLDSFVHPTSYERKAFSLPAGHTFHRISKAREVSFGSATYATHNADDYNRYLGNGFGNMIKFGEKMHHVSWTSKSEVKVPDLNTVLDTFKDVLTTHRGHEVSPEDVLKTYTGLSGSGWDSPEAKGLFRELTKKGFGAIVDEMDAGVHSDSPIVLFAHELMNAKKSDLNPLTMKDYLDARKALKPLKIPKL